MVAFLIGNGAEIRPLEKGRKSPVLTFSKNSFKNTIRLPNGLDPDQDRCRKHNIIMLHCFSLTDKWLYVADSHWQWMQVQQTIFSVFLKEIINSIFRNFIWGGMSSYVLSPPYIQRYTSPNENLNSYPLRDGQQIFLPHL